MQHIDKLECQEIIKWVRREVGIESDRFRRWKLENKFLENTSNHNDKSMTERWKNVFRIETWTREREREIRKSHKNINRVFFYGRDASRAKSALCSLEWSFFSLSFSRSLPRFFKVQIKDSNRIAQSIRREITTKH